MKKRNVGVLTEKDMEGSEHKLSSMSKFDKLLEFCKVVSEAYDQEVQNNVKNFDIRGSVDKSWEKRPVSTHDQESNKIVMFSSRTCRISGEELFKGGRKKSRGETSSSFRYEYANVRRSGGDQDDKVVAEKVHGNKRKGYYLKDENFVYPPDVLVKEKVPGKKRKCYDSKYEDSEFSGKKEKKPRRKNKARNKVVETPPLPVEFANEIQRLGGNDVRLLIQKELTNTDLEKDKNRLNISCNQVREEAKGFLTEAENEFLGRRNADNSIPKMQVPLLEPNLNRSRIDFKKWEMNNKSFWYVLCGPWTAMQKKNRLQAGKDLQVWSFRVNGDLNLALVKVPQDILRPDQPEDGNED